MVSKTREQRRRHRRGLCTLLLRCFEGLCKFKGISFEELAKLTDTPVRAVQFEINEADASLLRQIPGFE
eukprot:9343320-Karenia_brevis.AAC.1